MLRDRANPECTMPNYEVRLYKKTSASKNAFTEVDRIPFQANDDNEAVAMAPTIKISVFDDSDLAMLLRQDAKIIWHLKI